MAERLDLHEDHQLTPLGLRQTTLLIPAVGATCLIALLITFGILSQVAIYLSFRFGPDVFGSDGITNIPPSTAEHVQYIARFAALVLASVGLLALTWRFRRQGRTLATWACAVGAVLAACAVWW